MLPPIVANVICVRELVNQMPTIITALKHWKHFLYGREFTVKTDHQALKWLQTMPSADWSDRQSRWSQLFQHFGGMIEYLPGKHNPVADALSRKSGTIQSAQRTTVLDSSALDSMKEDYLDSAEFGTPYSLAMAGEPGHFSLQDGWLLYKGRLCITASHRAALLHDAHDSLVGGHQGINNTLEKLERSFYWPKLRKDVYNYVQKCQVCQKVKSTHQKPAGLLRPLPIPEGPFQDISMAFVGPLPASHPSRKHHVLHHCRPVQQVRHVDPLQAHIFSRRRRSTLHPVLVPDCRVT